MIGASIRRSVSRKFMFAVLTTTCAALLVSGIAMLLYDVQTYRTTWVSDLTTMSDILARVTLPALEFNDPKVAQENLAQLKARPTMMAGAIYAQDGTLFARYLHPGQAGLRLPTRPPADGYQIDGDRITVSKRIVRSGELLGTVYLEARYPLGERVVRYATILTLVMLASLGVALLVSLWLNAAVTRPIVAVTEAVHQVLRRRDFSSRVRKSTEDEIGVLVDAFNSMLAEVGERARAIEASNTALQQAMDERLAASQALLELNNTLETRIDARTAELERAHEQLRHSQKMEAIGQLTGGVAHDFNNVLQVVSGNLQLLQLSLGENAQAQKRLATAAFAADRGAKLSSQLLAFARRQPLRPIATNLGRVLRAMDDLLRRALGETIEIDIVVASGLWNTMVDPNQIENVILNLAINARDAMRGGGRLTLALGNATLEDQYVGASLELAGGSYVLLAITDTGSGMSAQTLERAFEPFFTTKREGEGTGLGLSMAYGFVKQSNGHIKIDSELGVGTAIRIYLPRALDAEVERRDDSAEPVTGGSETILVVEDDAAVQATVVDLLTGLGYKVLRAEDGAAAIAILREGLPVDLLFTDVVMPGPLRSPELARQARELLPGLQVLFTSGYTQDAIVHGGRLDAGVELLSKPYRREDLARKIRQLLGAAADLSCAPVIDARASVFGSPAAEPSAPPVALPMPMPMPMSMSMPTPMPMPMPMPASTSAPATGLRILVVEDNDDANLMICELLTLLGHRSQGVSSAEAALTALTEAAFDVLFTDVSLPGMSGVDLARRVVQDRPGATIVFSSGHGVVDTTSFGFDAVSLPKPYDLQALEKILADIAVPT